MTADTVLRARVLALSASGDLAPEQIAGRLGVAIEQVRAWQRRPLTFALRPCRGCGELFAPNNMAQAYCCPLHRRGERARRPERRCRLCGAAFTPVNGTQRYCCAAHRQEQARRRERARYHRQARQRVCRLCGRRFMPRTASQYFCRPSHEDAHRPRPQTLAGWRDRVAELQTRIAAARGQLPHREAA